MFYEVFVISYASTIIYVYLLWTYIAIVYDKLEWMQALVQISKSITTDDYSKFRTA